MVRSRLLSAWWVFINHSLPCFQVRSASIDIEDACFARTILLGFVRKEAIVSLLIHHSVFRAMSLLRAWSHRLFVTTVSKYYPLDLFYLFICSERGHKVADCPTLPTDGMISNARNFLSSMGGDGERRNLDDITCYKVSFTTRESNHFLFQCGEKVTRIAQEIKSLIHRVTTPTVVRRAHLRSWLSNRIWLVDDFQ